MKNKALESMGILVHLIDGIITKVYKQGVMHPEEWEYAAKILEETGSPISTAKMVIKRRENT